VVTLEQQQAQGEGVERAEARVNEKAVGCWSEHTRQGTGGPQKKGLGGSFEFLQ
jgi:hypothetical protein